MLNNLVISKVQGAFVRNCIALLGRAYENLLVSGVVNHDMDENTISENLRKLMRKDPSPKGIVIAREQPIDDGNLLTSDQKADALPRIDFQFEQSWGILLPTFVFFMEAKNLYAKDFIKTGNNSMTSAKAYHKRYVETGVTYLLDGYYPPNSCLLGYVLEGIVSDAVKGVNVQLSSMLSSLDILLPAQSPNQNIAVYMSTHSQGKMIKHLMLQF